MITKAKRPATNRRKAIIDAGLTVLRAHGFAGLTQPRVAAEAGVRQSHLTYYFPTRVDLLTAVARTAIDNQLAAVDLLLNIESMHAAALVIANVATRHENTRVLMALAQAADQEPQVRQMFRELADGIILRVGELLTKLNIEPSVEHRFLLHALSVGVAVIDLATAWPDGEERAANALQTTFALLASQSAARSKLPKASYSKTKSTSKKFKKDR